MPSLRFSHVPSSTALSNKHRKRGIHLIQTIGLKLLAAIDKLRSIVLLAEFLIDFWT